MIVWSKEKVDSLRPVEPNRNEPIRVITVITRSKGFDSCDKDIKCMSRKLNRLLEVVNDWSNDESSNIAVAIHKALEETIKRIQSDVDFSLRAYRIEDEEEKLELTKEITELINKAKTITNTEER